MLRASLSPPRPICRHRRHIVSTATLATNPDPGAASARPASRLGRRFCPAHARADDDVLRRASLYCDIARGATRESGDLADPLARGSSARGHSRGPVRPSPSRRVGPAQYRRDNLFKSVGHALEDLAALFWPSNGGGYNPIMSTSPPRQPPVRRADTPTRPTRGWPSAERRRGGINWAGILHRQRPGGVPVAACGLPLFLDLSSTIF